MYSQRIYLHRHVFIIANALLDVYKCTSLHKNVRSVLRWYTKHVATSMARFALKRYRPQVYYRPTYIDLGRMPPNNSESIIVDNLWSLRRQMMNKVVFLYYTLGYYSAKLYLVYQAYHHIMYTYLVPEDTSRRIRYVTCSA